MSFEPDNIDYEVDQISLLLAILRELKRLNVMVSEATEQVVTNEDLEE